MKLMNRIINKAERTILDILYSIGLQNYLLSSKKGAAILCYHGVALDGAKSLNMRHYSVKSIEEHFKLFKSFFNIISVSDYFHNNFVNSKLNIAITFDDGYKNNYKYLLPLIEKYKVPVSIYCTGANDLGYSYLWADFVDIVSYYSSKQEIEINDVYFKNNNKVYTNNSGVRLQDYIKNEGCFSIKEQVFSIFDDFLDIVRKNEIDDYWQLMTDNEIRDISNSEYVTIGSHGYYHNNLANISINDAKQELVNSKNYLENIMQCEINEIAYPDGSYSMKLVSVAEECGFMHQLVLDYTNSEDKNDNRIENRKGMYPVYSNINQIADINSLL